MNLTPEEFDAAKKIMEATLKLKINDIEKYLNEAVALFKSNLNMYDIDDRYKVFSFLDHMNSLFFNKMLNGDKYLLDEEAKATKARQIISKIFKNFREDGI
jgi:hypothetical protein